MQENCRNIYKIARELAGLTQEAAAMVIPCSVSSLRSYESDKATDGGVNVPDDQVRGMIKAYKAPVLALLHLKRKNSPLAEFIPDVIPPQTINDVGIHAILSQREVDDAVEMILRMLKDGKITPDEHADLERFARIMRVISGRTLSAAVYAETVLMQRGATEAA